MINRIQLYCKKGGFLFLFLCIALILNHRTGYITLIGIFSLLVLSLVTMRKKVDINSFAILAYSVMFVLLSTFNGFSYSLSSYVLYLVAPFVFYQFGRELVLRMRTSEYVLIAWLIIVICYSIDVFLTTISNIRETGILTDSDRSFYLTGSNAIQMSATVVGLSMNIGMIGLPMLFVVKGKLLRLSFFTLFILSLITTVSLLNRTAIVVAVSVFLIILLYKYKRNLKTFLLLLSILIGIIFMLMHWGFISSDIIELYNERNVDIATFGSRTESWSKAFEYLITRPLGWADSIGSYYVHNMWLDVARVSGIIPFILLAYITLDSMITAFKTLRKNETQLSYMLVGLNICFFASCFVEPVYGGTHMLLYFMLWGTTKAFAERELLHTC